MPGFPEYGDYDGLGLADLVRRGEVQPGELVEEAIGRIERINPRLNSVVHTMYARARELAASGPHDGPFAGVPFLLKDLLAAYAGEPLSSGSEMYRDWIAPQDSELVRRFKAAGFVTLGKTNTPELGILPVTEPTRWGPTRNPWDLERTPGGSSGGSAAAVAARMVPIASGGDGGGSIRIPASCCGLVGLKPTRGRTPTGPHEVELWQGFAIEHVLCRSVRDSAAVLDAIAGPDVGAPYVAPPPARPYGEEVGAPPGRLRIAFTAEPFVSAAVRPECVAAVQRAARLCADLGHEVEEARPKLDGAAFSMNFLIMLMGETAAEIRAAERLLGRRARYRDFEPETWVLALLGRQYGAVDFTAAVKDLKRLGRTVGRFFEGYDVLLTPTLAMPPVRVGELAPKGAEKALLRSMARLGAGRLLKALGAVQKIAENAWTFTPFTTLFNVTGQPAMSLPLHWSDAGLPIGVQLAARFGDEATLFRLAAQLEEAQPWRDRRPPASAG